MRETMWPGMLTGQKKQLYRHKLLVTYILILISSAGLLFAQTPAFPGAEGFGKYATGGRGGVVYKVTNLNNSGAGSLREAVQASGPRTVIFEVSGRINLTSNLEVLNDNITIAGQTAPGDGICISGAAFIVKAKNVVVRYIRFRLGDNGYKDENGNVVGTNGPDVDTVGVYGSTGGTSDVIFDHCSMSWSIDEIIGMYGSSNPANGVSNVTFQYCIFSEALWQSHHSDGSHSMSFLINTNVDNVTIYKNLFASSRERHIRAGGGCSFEMINNVVYDFRYSCVISAANEFTMIGNYYKEGNQSIQGSYVADFVAQSGYNNDDTRAYISGNTNNAGMSEQDPAFNMYEEPNPVLDSGINPVSASVATADVLANAGAILPQRDPVDTRIINQYNTNTGAVINTQAQVGGYPVYSSLPPPLDTDNDGMPDDWELNNGLNPTDPSDRNIVQPDGYTNLEYYLNDMQLTQGSVVNAGQDVTICEGESVTLTASGAVSYLWNTGATTASITVSPTETTTYVVTGTDSENNETVDSVTVFVNPLPTASAGADVSICEGESVTLSATGGGTYLWNNGATSANITVSPTETTTYQVTVSLNGCTDTDEVIVTVNAAPTADAGADVTIDEGQSATLTAEGGGTYLWNTGETTQSITVNPTTTTTYTVTVSLNGCEDEDSVTVFVNAPVEANAGEDVTICEGESTTLTATGGDTYLWSTGETTASITVSPTDTTTYSVTVSNGVNSDSDEVTVFVNPQPLADAGADATINLGESITLTASGGGNYLWSTGETTQSITVSPTVSTTYTVIVDLNGCQDSDVVVVFVNSNTTVDAGPDVTICEGESTTLTATGTASNYLWSNGESGLSITVSPTVTTTYTVYAYEEQISTAINDSVTVFVTDASEVDAGPDLSICEGETITITASGNGDFMVWNTGETGNSITVSPASTTTYTVTSNETGCEGTDSVTVVVNSSPNADAGQDVTICEGDSATLTASGGSSYQWSSGEISETITVSPSTTTTYTVTVSENGCESTDQVTVFVNPNPVADAGPDQNISNGETATLTASGGGTYLWSTGETTQTIFVSPSVTTSYTVTVNVNGCQDSDSVMVIVDEQVMADAGEDQTICEGDSVTLTASGGTDYLWSTGETTASIIVNPSTTTTYSVEVSSGNSSDTDEVTVFVNPSPTANAGPDQDICQGESTTLTASGGDSYLWNTGHTTATINVSPAATTTYTVIVSQNNCSSTDSVTVNVNESPDANAGPDQDICLGESVTLTASGGGTYLWSTGETSQSIIVSPTSSATYTVTVSQGGCEDTDQVTVTVNDVPTANAGADQTVAPGEIAVLSASGGDSYLWSTGETTPTIVVQPNQTTTYSVTVFSNGCEDTDTVTVFVDGEVEANAGEDVTICQGYSVTLTASGGDSYLWNTGATTASIEVNPQSTSTYTVIVSTPYGSDTDSVTVFVNPNPNVAVSGETMMLEGEFVTLSASGANSYIWSNGATEPNIAVSPSVSTTYSVTGYINDCSDTEEVTVTVVEQVEATVSEDQSICLGESITLTANGGDSYLWSNGETTQSIEVSPEEDTMYTVIVSNELDSDAAEVMVTVDVCETEEIPQDYPSFDFKVYEVNGPGQMNAMIIGLRYNAQFSIHDIHGKLIYSQDLLANNGQRYDIPINASAHARGIYIVTIVEKSEVRRKKILFR